MNTNCTVYTGNVTSWPWGSYVWPYVPQPPVQVLPYGSVVLPPALSDADLDRIADKVADRILRAKRKRR